MLYYQSRGPVILAAFFKAEGEKSRTRSARDRAAFVVQSRIMVKSGRDENLFEVSHYSSACAQREGRERGRGKRVACRLWPKTSISKFW